MLVLYEKPTCTTCKKTMELLKERGVDWDDVQYFIEPLSAAKIAELLDKMGIPPRELLRKRATAYKELGLEGSCPNGFGGGTNPTKRWRAEAATPKRDARS